MKEWLQWEKEQWTPSLAAWRRTLPRCLKTALLGIFLCFGALLTLGVNSPDTILEGTFFYCSVHWQEACGRWFIRLMDDAMGSVVMPPLFLAFNAFCAAAAVTLLAEWWQIQAKWAQVLAVLSLVTAPTMICLSFYVYSLYTVGFDLLVFTLAAYLLFTKRGAASFAGAVVCLCLGLAVYQGDLGITIGLVLMGLMFYCLEERSLPFIARQAGKALAAGALGFAAYYVSIHLWSALGGVPLADRGGLNGMTPLTLLAGIPGRLRGCYHNFKEYFYHLGTNHLGKILLFCLLCAVFVLGAGFVKLVLRRKPQAALLAVCGLALPVGLNVVYLAMDLDFHLDVSMPLQFMLPFALALAVRSQPLVFPRVWPARLVRLAAGGGAALLCWVCCVTAYASYYTLALAYRYVDTLSVGILSRVMSDERYTPDTRVLIAGAPDEEQSQKFNFLREKSLYHEDMVIWNNGMGILGGWMHYMYDYHGVFLGEVDLTEYYAVADSAAYAAMPCYPTAGCIELFDDIMVVKLQDELPR